MSSFTMLHLIMSG